MNLNAFGPSSSTSYGLSKPDNNSIYKTQEKCLRINYNALKTASSTNFGFIQPDNITTIVENGVLKMKNYSVIQQKIIELGNTISSLDNKLNIISNELNLLTPIETGPHIFTLVCDGLASVDLVKPEYYGELPADMVIQKITATFIVNTNCPFKIAMHYIDNISPAISLFEIKYNNVDSYPGETGLSRTYQSTNSNDVKISFSWLCKNYAAINTDNYSIKTRIFIDVMYSNDVSIEKEVKYSVVRFNSLYIGGIVNSVDDDEIFVNDETTNIIPIVDYIIKVDNAEYESNAYMLPSSTENSLYAKSTYNYITPSRLPWENSSIHDYSYSMNCLEIMENTSYEFTKFKPS